MSDVRLGRRVLFKFFRRSEHEDVNKIKVKIKKGRINLRNSIKKTLIFSRKREKKKILDISNSSSSGNENSFERTQ